MTYAELKAQFTALLNRTDLTAALTTTFVSMAMLRAARELRLPEQEILLSTTVSSSYAGIAVPTGFKQLIQLAVAGEEALTYITPATYLALDAASGTPVYYTRLRDKFQVYPAPAVDVVITMDYWGIFDALSADADTSPMTTEYPDLLIYGTLSYASDYYLDERATSFEQRYQSIRDELTNGGSIVDGATQVQPTVYFEDDR